MSTLSTDQANTLQAAKTQLALVADNIDDDTDIHNQLEDAIDAVENAIGMHEAVNVDKLKCDNCGKVLWKQGNDLCSDCR